jgi:hypothetical protein
MNTKWVLSADGKLLSLDHIQYFQVRERWGTKSNTKSYYLVAFTSGRSSILYVHPEAAVVQHAFDALRYTLNATTMENVLAMHPPPSLQVREDAPDLDEVTLVWMENGRKCTCTGRMVYAREDSVDIRSKIDNTTRIFYLSTGIAHSTDEGTDMHVDPPHLEQMRAWAQRARGAVPK